MSQNFSQYSEVPETVVLDDRRYIDELRSNGTFFLLRLVLRRRVYKMASQRFQVSMMCLSDSVTLQLN